MKHKPKRTPCKECARYKVLLGMGHCEQPDVGKLKIRLQMMLEEGEIPCQWWEQRTQ